MPLHRFLIRWPTKSRKWVISCSDDITNMRQPHNNMLLSCRSVANSAKSPLRNTIFASVLKSTVSTQWKDQARYDHCMVQEVYYCSKLSKYSNWLAFIKSGGGGEGGVCVGSIDGRSQMYHIWCRFYIVESEKLFARSPPIS